MFDQNLRFLSVKVANFGKKLYAKEGVHREMAVKEAFQLVSLTSSINKSNKLVYHRYISVYLCSILPLKSCKKL